MLKSLRRKTTKAKIKLYRKHIIIKQNNLKFTTTKIYIQIHRYIFFNKSNIYIILVRITYIIYVQYIIIIIITSYTYIFCNIRMKPIQNRKRIRFMRLESQIIPYIYKQKSVFVPSVSCFILFFFDFVFFVRFVSFSFLNLKLISSKPVNYFLQFVKKAYLQTTQNPWKTVSLSINHKHTRADKRDTIRKIIKINPHQPKYLIQPIFRIFLLFFLCYYLYILDRQF